MWGRATAALTAIALAGCGGGEHRAHTTLTKSDRVGVNVVAIAPPHSLPPPARAQFVAGRAVAAQAGCLACHVIGTQGNPGPGPNLTYVGARLRPDRLDAALISPVAPMPSFKLLPHPELTALVEFLSDLR